MPKELETAEDLNDLYKERGTYVAFEDGVPAIIGNDAPEDVSLQEWKDSKEDIKHW